MVISKELAGSIARKLTQKKYDALEKTKKDISDLAYEIAKAGVKKDIFEMYEKNKSYFNTTSQLALIGQGLNNETVSIKSIPSDGSWSITKTLNNKHAETFVILFDKQKTQKKELQQLNIEIEAALLGLRTFKKITDQFPEAAKYLPVKENRELMINISAIVKKL